MDSPGHPPSIVALAGPNGAGKSTVGPPLLKETLGVTKFVNADLAIARVKDRVRVGGHDIPDATVRRRYSRGLSNFFELYRPLATSWRVYDSSGPCKPELVAAGRAEETNRVVVPDTWQRISRSASDERKRT